MAFAWSVVIGAILSVTFYSIGRWVRQSWLLAQPGRLYGAEMNPPRPAEVEKNPMPGPILAIEDQIYNLGEPNRYLKATILLEMNSDNKSDKQLAGLNEEVKKRESQIRDIVIRVISGKTYREVNSPQGKEQLKDELRTRINEVLARGEIKRIMFTSFAVQ